MRMNHFESHHSGHREPVENYDFVIAKLLAGALLVKAASAPL